MSDITVLVVDDEVRMRKLIKDFLIKKGYGILEAGDGEEALTVFEEELNDYKNKQDTIYNQLIVLLGDRNTKEIIRNNFDNLTLPDIPDSITADAISQRPDLIKTAGFWTAACFMVSQSWPGREVFSYRYTRPSSATLPGRRNASTLLFHICFSEASRLLFSGGESR